MTVSYNKELLEWIVKKAIDVKIDGVMIRTKESNEILEQNKIDSDPFLQFVNEIIVPTDHGYKFQDTTYQVYKRWFEVTGHKLGLETDREFNKRIRKDTDIKQGRRWRNNHKLQVWLNIEFNTYSGNINEVDIKDIKRTQK